MPILVTLTDRVDPRTVYLGGVALTVASHLGFSALAEGPWSAAIVVGGGPAIVRNNISASNEAAGIGLEDYKKRGLLRSIVVVNNTVYRNGTGGITIPESGVSGVIIVNNAADAGIGPRAYPKLRTRLRLVDAGHRGLLADSLEGSGCGV